VNPSPTDRLPLRRLPPGRLLALGFAVFVAGRVVDLIWHATHEEFETASDQLQAHAVVWAGTLILIAASAAAVFGGTRNRGYGVVLAGAISYAAVAVWHFWEHLQLRDPDLPHLLLLIANIVIVGGVVWVWIAGSLLTSRVPPRR
jgi:hypothetical protein